MKLAVVVQRYGAEINGGAEQHARYVAEHLARHHDVEVLTTSARDYITWRNDIVPGVETVHGITVRRFPVDRERDPVDFGRRSRIVFERPHSARDELQWLESEGPTSSALVNFIREQSRTFDYFLFFSFRYYHAYHGCRAVPDQAVLVPTAERDPAVGISIFAPVFRGVRAVMYNSFEERRMIQTIAGNRAVPGIVVGIGSELPERTYPQRFRRAFGITTPFVVYVGRIDENKGCKELFTYFQLYAQSRQTALTLVLIGNSILPIPDHPRIRHLGFLPDRDKFDAIAAAEALVMPSYFESLSMVALEAWGLGRPVLANGRCEVLRGQCIRSNAGLYYENHEEFAETLSVFEHQRIISAALAANGRDYFRRHYAWPVIERKYLDMFALLDQQRREGVASRTPEPLPGWFARRRRDKAPARDVVAAVPFGPVIPTRKSSHRPRAVAEA
jgi:glycosyltransferase involved in cell wall biosynthesis